MEQSLRQNLISNALPQNQYIKLYSGTPLVILALVNALEEVGIIPVLKDPSASARMAGFGSMTNEQTLWVHPDELDKAQKVLSQLTF